MQPCKYFYCKKLIKEDFCNRLHENYEASRIRDIKRGIRPENRLGVFCAYEHCEKEFKKRHANQKFCTKYCKKLQYSIIQHSIREKRKENTKPKPKNKEFIGKKIRIISGRWKFHQGTVTSMKTCWLKVTLDPCFIDAPCKGRRHAKVVSVQQNNITRINK